VRGFQKFFRPALLEVLAPDEFDIMVSEEEVMAWD
jgi:hypothetical protein